MRPSNIVSEINDHETDNALDQPIARSAHATISSSDAQLNGGDTVMLEAQTEFQLQQMVDMLYRKWPAWSGTRLSRQASRRNVASRAYQTITLKRALTGNCQKITR